MISYRNDDKKKGVIQVRLDSKHVGNIEPFGIGFRYRPKGSKSAGEVMSSIQRVKESIEEE